MAHEPKFTPLRLSHLSLSLSATYSVHAFNPHTHSCASTSLFNTHTNLLPLFILCPHSLSQSLYLPTKHPDAAITHTEKQQLPTQPLSTSFSLSSFHLQGIASPSLCPSFSLLFLSLYTLSF